VTIPGTETLIKVAGYVKADFIYDTKPIGSYDYFVTSEIPTSGPDTKRGTQFTVHAKQTRINVDVRRDTERGPARVYFEADGFGDPSFGFQPGSHRLHLRHAFAAVNNFGAGYSFSAFMDNDALPDTLDFEGPGAAPFLTLAGARYIWKLTPSTNLALSVEAPSSDVTTPSGSGKSNFPDVALRGRFENDRGHVQLSAVYRYLGWYDGTGLTDHANGYGLNLAGSYKFASSDYLVAGAVGGKGIARYVSDITGLGLDAVVDANGNLQALKTYGGYAGYTHHWSETLRSTAVAGHLGMSNEPYQAPTSFTSSQYYSANVIWNPWASVNVGMEVLHGRNKTLDGNRANDTRIQASFQYDFTR